MRWRIPWGEAADRHLSARIQTDVEAVFGDDGYRRLTRSDSPVAKDMLNNDPIDCGDTIMIGCEMDEVVV